MLTTCPECRTTFRIVHDQLDMRRGMVRCGYCRAVFNAYDMLRGDASEAPTAAPATTAAEPQAAVPPPPAPVAALEAVVPPPPGRAPEPPAGHADDTNDALLLSELPTRIPLAPAAARRSGVAVVLSVLLAVLLVTQTVYFLRSPILTAAPQFRPVYEDACRILGCTVPLAASLDALQVEASSLETDPEHPGRATLRVSLSNRSRHPQSWPHLVLKLTDTRSQPLAQRVFRPRDFLPPEVSVEAGLAARGERELRLALELGGIAAAGYEVRPLYP